MEEAYFQIKDAHRHPIIFIHSGNLYNSPGNCCILQAPVMDQLCVIKLIKNKKHNTMSNFKVPTREEVSAGNQQIFDNLQKQVGRVPNLFAAFAASDSALGNYLTFSSGKSSLRAKEKEVINLVVSQLNECNYCLSAHTAIAKLNGFNDEQIIEIRRVNISFDAKLDVLAKFVQSVVENKGQASAETRDAFFAAGYTYSNMIDAVLVIGDKMITNYVYALTGVPVDWPSIPDLHELA